MRNLFSILVLLLLATQTELNAKKVKHLTPSITWELQKDGTLIISGQGEMPKLERSKYPWEKKANKITSVIICDGITTIGSGSFSNDTYHNRFYRISSIILPSTLKVIGHGAFERNRNLQTVKIPLGVTSIGIDAFSDCNIKTLSLPTTLHEISDGAFSNNNLSELHIPEGVEEIGAFAFYNCAIKKLSLPTSLKVISYAAFAENNLSELHIPEGVVEIGAQAFGKSLTSSSTLYIPYSVKSIGSGAFATDYYHYHSGTSIKREFNGTILKLPRHISEKSDCERIGIAWNSYEKYDPSDRDFFNEGIKLYNTGDYRTALNSFKKGCTARVHSTYENYNAKCYRYAGKCYVKLNELTNALQMYTQAHKLGEYSSTEIHHLEDKLTEIQWNKKGEEELNKSNYDSAFNSYIELSRHYKKTGRHTEQLDILNIVPKYFEEREDYSNAIKYYEKVYEITKSGSTANHIGEIYYFQHNYNDAIEWFSVEANKGNRDAQYKLAQAYEKNKNTNLATFWYKKSAEQGNLKAEESLAILGIYLTPKQSATNTPIPNTKTSTSSGEDHKSISTTSESCTPSDKNGKEQDMGNNINIYSPEYGFRDVWVQCTMCLGSGKCFACKGEGWCVSTRSNSTWKCNICFGTCRCQTCHGTGGHYEKQMYQIK